MRAEDARAFLEVHRQAVRGLASSDYPREVIDAWAPLPITAKHIDIVRANADREYRLVAEADGEIIGIGGMVARNHELRACYVAPSASRKGVGSAILCEIERAARDQGLATLEADSSLTAERFYRANGYEACDSGEHVLSCGTRMASVRMRKRIMGVEADRRVLEEDCRSLETMHEDSPMSPPASDSSDPLLRRIAEALERLAPAAPGKPDFDAAEAFVWRAEKGTLAPVAKVNRVDISLLRGVDRVRDLLVENTERFARGLPANNALLWGARGMGKSSLVKAAQAAINRRPGVDGKLKLVEIHREDIEGLPALMSMLRESPYRFIVFCDDLSFDAGDASYKSLKAALEGGVEGRPANVLFYATSNRRHLLSREMMENERSSAINPGEAVEEKVSLSDRFGLWLGFHHCSQDDYLAMVHGYAKHYGLDAPAETIERDALEWATTRGSRSGRTAWQFTQDLAGRLGKPLVAAT